MRVAFKHINQKLRGKMSINFGFKYFKLLKIDFCSKLYVLQYYIYIYILINKGGVCGGGVNKANDRIQ